MKNILSIAGILIVLWSLSNKVVGKNNLNEGNVSSLYLKVFDNKICKITLNGMKLKQMDDLYTINGLKPGQYLLRIALLPDENNAKEKVIYHNYINIKAKKVIFAYIDKKHELQIISQRTTTTVQVPNKKNKHEKLTSSFFPIISPYFLVLQHA